MFHLDNGLMFCSSCNIVIDHLRKSVVDRHLKSAIHKQRGQWNQGSKQQMLKTVLYCKTSAKIKKVKICQEWMRACAASNIPLHKSDNPLMRKFLQRWVANDGGWSCFIFLRFRYTFMYVLFCLRSVTALNHCLFWFLSHYQHWQCLKGYPSGRMALFMQRVFDNLDLPYWIFILDKEETLLWFLCTLFG